MTLVIFTLDNAKKFSGGNPKALWVKSTGEVAWASDALRQIHAYFYPGCVIDECGDVYIFGYSPKLTKYSHSGQKLGIYDIVVGLTKIIVTNAGDIVMLSDWKSSNHTEIVIHAKNELKPRRFQTRRKTFDFDVNLTNGQLFTTNSNGIEIYN
jgi:hypothetical protein